MKRNKKAILHMLLVIAMITTVVGLTGFMSPADAVVDDKGDGVYFSEQYAEAGKVLTVKYDGSETDLEYKWYVGGKAVVPEGEPVDEKEDATFDITKEHYQKNIKAEVWAAGNKLGEASMFVSKLPVLYIDTEGGAEVVTKDYYLNAQMHLQGNALYNSDNTTLYTGATEIKGRGNSTWELFPKKPYRLKLDKKTDLFGMGKEKNWVLLANYIDESGMRNMLAGDVATRLNVGKMDGTWVEVVMNGENLGLYMICEHVRLSEDRVDVFDWESAGEDIAEAIADADGYSKDEHDALETFMVEEDMSWISTGEVVFNGKTYKTAEYYEGLPSSFSGGWLMEMDYGYDEVSKFTTDNGATLMFKSPEFICTDEIAMNTVKEYVQTFEDALYSKDFNTVSGDKTVSYTEFVDMDSMVNFWFASEFLMNEIGCKSTYFQKDIDQNIKFGPVWDFDFSSGSVSPFSAQNACDWTSDNKYWNGTQDKWWFVQAMKDPYFAVKARNIYLENEEYFKNIISKDGLLDGWYDYLKEAGDHNYELWKYSRGFDADCQALAGWLDERISWMDKQFASDESAIASLGGVLSDKVKLSLNGEGVTHSGGSEYVLKSGSESFDMTAAVGEGEYTELNYYINSKYQGTVPVADGKANIVVREDQLTETVGSDNVITVWLKDKDGSLTEQQFLTVKVIADQVMYNVVFNDMGGTRAVKVIAGEKVYLDEPQQMDKNTVFLGWSDGKATYEAGKKIAVSGDVTLNAVWEMCSDGTNIHDFADKEDVRVCIKDKCDVSTEIEKEYINITACALTCSNRYDNYYTGKEIKPVVTLSYGGEKLIEGTHYTITYKNTVGPGYATYVIKAIDGAGYKGEYELSYRILPQDLAKADVKVTSKALLSAGVAEPEVAVSFNGTVLKAGTDYEVSYAKNTAVGKASVTVKGIGGYTGSITKNFDVVATAKSVTKCTFGSIGTKAYTGKAVKPVVSVKDGSLKLVEGVNYTVAYSNNTKCGTATVKITGVKKNGYTGTKSVTFKIRPAKVVHKVENVKYNQQKVTWNKVTGATEYRVYRSSNNKTFKLMKTVKSSASRVYKSTGLEAGRTYYYKVRAVRKSGGSTYLGIQGSAVKMKTVLYKGVIKSAKNTAKGTATIKWVGVNGAHGYKIYRSTTGKDGSFKLIKTVKKVKQFKNTGLKKGKTYYYKVKAYRVVGGKNVYGALSKPWGVKIKK